MGVGGRHLCRNQRLKKSLRGSTPAPPTPPPEAARTESLVGKSREGLSKTEGQGANITVSTEEKVNGTAAGAECGKCRSGGWGLGGNWTCTGEVLAREETAVDYVPLILQPSAFQAVFLFCL